MNGICDSRVGGERERKLQLERILEEASVEWRTAEALAVKMPAQKHQALAHLARGWELLHVLAGKYGDHAAGAVSGPSGLPRLSEQIDELKEAVCRWRSVLGKGVGAAGFRVLHMFAATVLLALLTYFAAIQVLGRFDPHHTLISMEGIPVTNWKQGWGKLQVNRSVRGRRLSVAGITYRKGLGTHSPSEIFLSFEEGRYRRLSGLCGVDDEIRGEGRTAFRIAEGGRNLFESGVMKKGDPAVPFNVDVSGLAQVRLMVDDGDGSTTDDHADWLQLRLE